VNDYNLLVPTNAHILLMYVYHLIWQLYVSADEHHEDGEEAKVKYILL
jgi:hypothetical protein